MDKLFKDRFTKEDIAEQFPEEREPMDLESFLRNDLIVVNRYAGEGGTRQTGAETYHVALGVENPEVFKELLNRASFDEFEYEGKNVSFFADFCCHKGLHDTAGITVAVMDKHDGSYESGIAGFTDEEKLAFFTHVIEEKPESELFVRYSMDMVMERMEQDKEQNRHSQKQVGR